MFYIAGGVYVVCATFYNIFGSGRRQDWDNPADDEANAKKAANKKADKIERKAAKNQNHAETAHWGRKVEQNAGNEYNFKAITERVWIFYILASLFIFKR